MLEPGGGLPILRKISRKTVLDKVVSEYFGGIMACSPNSPIPPSFELQVEADPPKLSLNLPVEILRSKQSGLVNAGQISGGSAGTGLQGFRAGDIPAIWYSIHILF